MMKVDLSCPLELWEYSLPGEANGVCTLLLFNLENKTIASMQLTLVCYGSQGEELSTHTERPMALNAMGKQSFELSLPLDEGPDIHSLSLVFDKVWFEDGTAWRRAASAQLVSYVPNELQAGRHLENLRYVAGPDAVGYPEDQGPVWLCVCGRVNGESEDRCRRCGRDRQFVFMSYTPEAVGATINVRERELESKGRNAREEASRQEFLRQEALKRRKGNRKRRWISAGIVAALIVLLYFLVVLGAPEIKYQQAVAAFNQGNLDTSRSMFVELLDYRDAPERVRACDYAYAESLLTSNNLSDVDKAIEIFEGLSGFSDAADRLTEAHYTKGVMLLTNGEYERAAYLFGVLGAYQDAAKLYKLAEYKLATRAMNARDYQAAADRFLALGDYDEAANLAQLCIYRAAVTTMAEERYQEAADLFSRILDYNDASTQYKESLYQAGLQLKSKGEFETAAAYFHQLDNFRDAWDQYRDCMYEAAIIERNAGEYAKAVSILKAIVVLHFLHFRLLLRAGQGLYGRGRIRKGGGAAAGDSGLQGRGRSAAAVHLPAGDRGL